jgi:SulP family sulfate permease
VVGKQHGYSIDPNRELVAIGVCNILCSFFQGYPVTGSFSRTAINSAVGAKSAISSVVAALVVGIALLTLTPFLEFLPKGVLAAIVAVSVVNLIDVKVRRRGDHCVVCSE